MNRLKRNDFSSRTADKFVVRLPDGVRDVVTELARQQRRSMNAYLVVAIENQIRLDSGEERSTLPQRWMPEVNDAVWLKGGVYSPHTVMVRVTAKHVVYNDFAPVGTVGNAAPEVLLDVEYLVVTVGGYHPKKIEKVSLTELQPAEL